MKRMKCALFTCFCKGEGRGFGSHLVPGCCRALEEPALLKCRRTLYTEKLESRFYKLSLLRGAMRARSAEWVLPGFTIEARC